MSYESDSVSEYSYYEETIDGQNSSCSEWSLKRYTAVSSTKDLLTLNTDDLPFESEHDLSIPPFTASSLLIPTECIVGGRSKDHIPPHQIQALLPTSILNSHRGHSAFTRGGLAAEAIGEYDPERNSYEHTKRIGSPTAADSLLVAIAMRAEMQLQQQRQMKGEDEFGPWDASYRIFPMDLEDSDGRLQALSPTSLSPPHPKSSPSPYRDRSFLPHRPISPTLPSRRKWNPPLRLASVPHSSRRNFERNRNTCIGSDSPPSSSEQSLLHPLYPLSMLPTSIQSLPKSVLPSAQSIMSVSPVTSKSSAPPSPKSHKLKSLRSSVYELPPPSPPPSSPGSSSTKIIKTRNARERLDKRYQEIMGIMVGLHDIMARKVSKHQNSSLPSTPEEPDSVSNSNLTPSILDGTTETTDSKDSSGTETDSVKMEKPQRPSSLPVRRETSTHKPLPRPETAPDHSVCALLTSMEKTKCQMTQSTKEECTERNVTPWETFLNIQEMEHGISWSARVWRLLMWMGWVLWVAMSLRASCVVQGFATRWLPPAGIQDILCLLEIMGLLETLWLLKKVSIPISTVQPTQLFDASTMTETNPSEYICNNCCYF